MARLLACPYPGSNVELTENREKHILVKHPDLLPEHFEAIRRTLVDPDEVRRDSHFAATHLFSRWFEDIKRGKLVVVAVVSEALPVERHWVATAYLARKVVQGATEWKRS